MTTLALKIKARLPSPQQIWPVFSIILFIVFSWMLVHYFYQLPSWLFYMIPANILILLAYTLSFSLIESFLVLGYVVFLCIVFPARYFKEIFIAQGSVQVFIITVLTYALRQRIEDLAAMEWWILGALFLGLILILALTVVILYLFFNRFPVVARWVSNFADRMTIFLYIYAPLGVLGTLIVIMRNIY